MKFIRLEILNLASLDRAEGEQIDFEEGVLGKSNIFSIVGPTGSGKSTILDAICLALYGRAPRYPRTKGKRDKITIYGTASDEEKNRPAPTDCCNILTRGKKNGYSKLTFKANDGSVYRAEWSVRFKQKIFEEPNTSLYKLLPNGGVEECNWDNLPQIIGLDYEQFLRTVLIAQGTFANFLNSNEEDRYKLLEKLIGSEKTYDKIAKKIREEYDAANTAFTEKSTEHSTLDANILKEPELTTVTDRIKQLDDEDKAAENELDDVKKAIDWYTKDEEYLSDINEQGEKFKTAQQNLTDYQPFIDRLDIHDATVDAVKYYQDYIGHQGKVKKIEDDLKTLEDNILKIKSDITNAVEKELPPLRKAADDAAAELEKQKPHINKARAIKIELEALKKTLDEKKNANDLADQASKAADKAVKDNADNIGKFKTDKEAAEAALKTLKETIKAEKEEKEKAVTDATKLFDAEAGKIKDLDATVLQDADTKARAKKTDLTSAIRIRKDIAEKSAKLANNNADKEKLVQRNSEIDTELSTLNIKALRDELETLNKFHTLMTSDDWQQHRAALVDDKPCPLCGALHHPYKDNAIFVPVVSEHGKLIGDKKAALDKMEEKVKGLSGEQKENNGKLDGLKIANDTLVSDLKNLQHEWTPIHTNYPDWPESPELLELLLSGVNEEAEQAKNALADYNEILSKKEKLRNAKEKAKQELEEYDKESNSKIEKTQKKVTDAEKDLSTEQGKTQNLLDQRDERKIAAKSAAEAYRLASAEVTEKQQQLKAELGDRDPDVYEKHLEDAQEKAKKVFEDKKEDIGKLKEKLSGLKGKVEPTQQQKEAEQGEASKNKRFLDSWLASYNASSDPEQHLSVEKVMEISGYTDDWAAVRSKKEDLQGDVISTRTTLENTQHAHNSHQATKPEKDKALLVARKAELEQRSKTELVNLNARMQRHEDALKQLGPIAEQLQAAETKKEAWRQINDAIGGDGKTLRKIAQCYTLGFLIEHANAEIRKFNSRYELQQVKNSLGIRVIDHDRADDVRDTTSLSGGETFIVSLGLALGLSSLSSRHIALENLFIDEGFGTLDPDTLSTVITSLAMLQSSQGKKVGVISHTDTMSELISTKILVNKIGNTGSSRIEITTQ